MCVFCFFVRCAVAPCSIDLVYLQSLLVQLTTVRCAVAPCSRFLSGVQSLLCFACHLSLPSFIMQWSFTQFVLLEARITKKPSRKATRRSTHNSRPQNMALSTTQKFLGIGSRLSRRYPNLRKGHGSFVGVQSLPICNLIHMYYYQVVCLCFYFCCCYPIPYLVLIIYHCRVVSLGVHLFLVPCISLSLPLYHRNGPPFVGAQPEKKHIELDEQT